MAKVFADDIILGYTGTDPYLVCTDATVYDVGGNNNGRLDPDETVDLTATLFNIGNTALNNLSTSLTTSSPYITIIDNAGFFGYLGIDSVKENTSDPYVISALASTPQGHDAAFNLIVTADGGFIDTLSFHLYVGQAVPSDTGYYYAYYSGGIHPQSPVFEWTAIDSTQSVNPGISLNLFDNQTVTVDLPFTFRYYGTNYTQISICSNGWIAMGSTIESDWLNTAIPSPDGPSAMVAGLWSDLDPGNTGAPSDIYHYYDAVNHRFIIEYFQVEHWPSGSNETFEIILCDPAYYETPTGDGEIIVQYLISMQQVDVTIGIENNSEGVGIEYYYNGQYDEFAATVTDSFAIRYTTIPPDQVPGIEEDERETSLLTQERLLIYPTIAKGRVTICYSKSKLQTYNCLKVYDATGRLVESIPINQSTNTRTDQMSYDFSHLPAGIYFVYVENETLKFMQKLILMK